MYMCVSIKKKKKVFKIFVLRLTWVHIAYAILSCMIKQFLWAVTAIWEAAADNVSHVLLWQVPVAHCFGPPGHYKRKFCTVCRKSLESPAFRCEGNLKSPTCIAICMLSSSICFSYSAYLGCVGTYVPIMPLLCLKDFRIMLSTHWQCKCVPQVKAPQVCRVHGVLWAHAWDM